MLGQRIVEHRGELGRQHGRERGVRVAGERAEGVDPDLRAGVVGGAQEEIRHGRGRQTCRLGVGRG